MTQPTDGAHSHSDARDVPAAELIRALHPDSTKFVELRCISRDGQPPRQEFRRADDVDAIGARAVDLADTCDVYFGVLPRSRRAGTADACDASRVLWADADSEDAIRALAGFDPWPSIVVRTSAVGLHAYWLLDAPLAPQHVARANRRLAHRLNCDLRATDPARILRLPGTFNHKSNPPRPVRVERFELGDVFSARDLVGGLADPTDAPPVSPMTVLRDVRDDAILGLPSSVYAPALLRTPARRDGKLRCPFHHDNTPSLQTYIDPAKGWVCFGCERGGTAIDFGAHLYGIEPRGRGYWEIRRRLADDLLREAA